MISTGKIYTSESGERFLILAKKSRTSSNGHNYIGENTRSGLITFFNHLGQHVLCSDWNLKVDRYKWIGILPDNTLAGEQFVPKDNLETEFPAYLRIEGENPTTICYIARSKFEATYA